MKMKKLFAGLLMVVMMGSFAFSLTDEERYAAAWDGYHGRNNKTGEDSWNEFQALIDDATYSAEWKAKAIWAQATIGRFSWCPEKPGEVKDALIEGLYRTVMTDVAYSTFTEQIASAHLSLVGLWLDSKRTDKFATEVTAFRAAKYGEPYDREVAIMEVKFADKVQANLDSALSLASTALTKYPEEIGMLELEADLLMKKEALEAAELTKTKRLEYLKKAMADLSKIRAMVQAGVDPAAERRIIQKLESCELNIERLEG